MGEREFRAHYGVSPKTVHALGESGKVVLNLYARDPAAWRVVNCDYLTGMVDLAFVNGERVDKFFRAINPAYDTVVEKYAELLAKKLTELGQHSPVHLSRLLQTRGNKVDVRNKAAREARRWAYIASLAPEISSRIEEPVDNGQLEEAFRALAVWKELASPYSASVGGDTYWKPEVFREPTLLGRLVGMPSRTSQQDREIRSYIKEKVIGIGKVKVPAGISEKNLLRFLSLPDVMQRKRELNEAVAILTRELNAGAVKDANVGDVARIVADIESQMQDLARRGASVTRHVILEGLPVVAKYFDIHLGPSDPETLQLASARIKDTSDFFGSFAARHRHADRHRLLLVLKENESPHWLRAERFSTRFIRASRWELDKVWTVLRSWLDR
jgi:hypothetical protein